MTYFLGISGILNNHLRLIKNLEFIFGKAINWSHVKGIKKSDTVQHLCCLEFSCLVCEKADYKFKDKMVLKIMWFGTKVIEQNHLAFLKVYPKLRQITNDASCSYCDGEIKERLVDILPFLPEVTKWSWRSKSFDKLDLL